MHFGRALLILPLHVFRHDLRVKSGELATEISCHTFTTQQEVLCSDTSLHDSDERWSSRVQQTEAGLYVLTPLQRSHDHIYSTTTPLSALIATNSLHIYFSKQPENCAPFMSVYLCCMFGLHSVDHSSSPETCWICNGKKRL